MGIKSKRKEHKSKLKFLKNKFGLVRNGIRESKKKKTKSVIRYNDPVDLLIR